MQIVRLQKRPLRYRNLTEEHPLSLVRVIRLMTERAK